MIEMSVTTKGLAMRLAAVCAGVGVLLLAGGCGKEEGRSRKKRDGGGDGSALFEAIDENDPDALEEALADGVSPMAHEGHADTALHVAALLGRRECVDVLLKHGGDPDATDDRGATPLHRAAGHDSAECTEVVAALLRAGATADAVDEAGKSPFDYALEGGNAPSAKLLLTKGQVEDYPSLTGKELSSVPGVSIRGAVEHTDNRSSHTCSGPWGPFEGKSIPLRRALRMMCPESTHVCGVGPLPKGRFNVTVSGRGRGREGGWRRLAEACERAFGVTIRREPRQMDAYVLRRAPGAELGLQKAGTGDEKTAKSLSSSPYRLEFTAYSMDEVARVLEWELRVPVLNESGLAGAYTFTAEREPGEAESAAAGLRNVGLDLVRARRRVEVLVVESVGARKAP